MKSKNTFLVNLGKDNADTPVLLHDCMTDEFKEGIVSTEKLSGGINSEAFRILTDDNNEYFAKRYYRRKGDSRDRLSTEFSGLSFLWMNGVRNIPEPLKACKSSQVAIYSFVQGDKIWSDRITSADVDKAADFAVKLQSLTALEKASAQPIASEACFSIQAYIDCVENRIEKHIKRDSVPSPVRVYIENEFKPFFKLIKEMAVRRAEGFGIDIDEELKKQFRTLSASDFGFHNAIKAVDGKLFFIDFEYYGWDDPVKMIADFYLQPAVPVPLNYRKRFFEKVRKSYVEGSTLEKRLSIVYPVLGLKWCLIMLNIFIHTDSDNRCRKTCLEQLAKASEKLKSIKKEMNTGEFPYGIKEA